MHVVFVRALDIIECQPCRVADSVGIVFQRSSQFVFDERVTLFIERARCHPDSPQRGCGLASHVHAVVVVECVDEHVETILGPSRAEEASSFTTLALRSCLKVLNEPFAALLVRLPPSKSVR